MGLVVAALVAALLTWSVAHGGSAVAGFDAAVAETTRSWADPLGWPVDVAGTVGRVTAPLWSALAAAALVVSLALVGHRAAAAFLALSGVLGVLTSEVVKSSVARARPPGAEEHVQDLDVSFPSGHAMLGISFYVAAGLVLIRLGQGPGRRWSRGVGVLLLVVGPGLGLSRLVLGVHWPSDVVAGWAFGCVVLCSSALILWTPLARGWDPLGATGPAPVGAPPPLAPPPAGGPAPEQRTTSRAPHPGPGQPGAGTTHDPPGR